ncbi:hypothetical protein ACWIUD_09700 [Helicobacter sp. 23-1044]
MKIEFRKIGFEAKPFNLHLQGDDFEVQISGALQRMQNESNLIKIDSAILGEMRVICDRSGEIFSEKINEKTAIFVKNGAYNSNDDSQNLAVIEVFDDFINLDEIFLGEIESLKLDYHIKE